MTRQKWYVGHKFDYSMQAFKSAAIPTRETHGHLYFATTGPFRTKRGALYMAKYAGWNNPHLVTVADAEYYAKEQAKND